jgi:hypothetical protein
MKTIDPVLIRVWKNDASDIFALLPTIPADCAGHLCTSYQHVGQHGSADYHHCIRSSRPATKVEAADLLIELRTRGYNPRVYHRASYAMHRTRREALGSI